MKLRAQLSSLTAVLCLAALAPAAARAGTSWVPLGPDVINDGQAWPGRIPVTGRINVVAPNPENPFSDVWIGSATGGVWHGSVFPTSFWQPMTDDQPTLAVGSIALDNCSKGGCGTVWVGTGEDNIRRDTQYGRGILKGQWNSSTNVYDWTLLGEDHFARGNVTKVVLDPATSGFSKVVFAALSTGQTSNGTHSTVTTAPAGHLGVWRSKDAGQTWKIVLDHNTAATDLEMDPQNPKILFAGLRHDGIYRSLDGGNTWQAMGNGIPAQRLAAADWPELAVHRTAAMDAAMLYVALSACPSPQEKGDPFWCAPALYASLDGGDHWQLVHDQEDPPPAYGDPLSAYSSYTHALTIDPLNPLILWYGGINLYRSPSGGLGWDKVGNDALHPDHHQVVVIATSKVKSTGRLVYDVNDGGLFVGDGETQWNGAFQQGLAVNQALSVSATPDDGFLMAGTQDNGTNFYEGTEVWQHSDDGDSSSTAIDLDDPSILYDVYFGAVPRRCKQPCGFGWTWQTSGLGEGYNASWYPPLTQDPTAVGGQHALYIPTTRLYRSTDDAGSWTPVSPLLGSPMTIAELAGIQNPISAVAVAPSDPDRIYVGYYDGEIFTTANGQSASPTWTPASGGITLGRPVTALAVHPANPATVFAAFAGFGTHGVFRSTTSGASWGPLDDSVFGDLSAGSVNTLAIEPHAPYVVWAGTDNGVYSRGDADSSLTLWYRDQAGLPNVAVYDLELAKDGEVLYAATHGRGVWRRSLKEGITWPEFYEEACCGYFDPYVPAPFVSVQVSGFDPAERCSMALYEGARLCGTSAVDADGGTLSTDAHGFLVSSKAGVYTARKVSWACYGGTCAGGVPYSRCQVSEVEVTCGRTSSRAAVKTAQETREPSSTSLSFVPTGREGSFTLTPTLHKTRGLTAPLCAVEVRYSAEDTDERVLTRAADAVSSDERCRRAGVRAVLTGSSSPGAGEDEGPVPFRLSLEAREQTGVQLVTEVSGTGASALSVGSFGDRRQGSLVVPRVALSGRAAGGRLEVTEVSPLGTCTFGVDTAAGDSAETVAAALARAFLAPPVPSETLSFGPGCPERQNARDVSLDGAVVRFALGRRIAVASTDPGLAFTVGSDR